MTSSKIKDAKKNLNIQRLYKSIKHKNLHIKDKRTLTEKLKMANILTCLFTDNPSNANDLVVFFFFHLCDCQRYKGAQNSCQTI